LRKTNKNERNKGKFSIFYQIIPLLRVKVGFFLIVFIFKRMLTESVTSLD